VDVSGAPGTFQDIPGAVISSSSDVTGNATFGDPTAFGTIYIRIEDTGQTAGTNLDKVNVDFVAINSL